MKRQSIHRGGIVSAGYDPTLRILDVEFDTGRVLRCEGIGATMAERFLRSSSPYGYWKDEIEDAFPIREISAKECSEAEAPRKKKSIDELKRLFGDL